MSKRIKAKNPLNLIRLRPVIDRWMKQTAACLNKKVDRVTRKKMRYIVIAFTLTWALLVCGILYKSIRRPGKVFSITAVSIPRHVQVDKNSSALTSMIIQRITRAKKYLDSLKKSNPAAYDSLKRSRPGLIDRLYFIETYYSPLK